MGIDENACWSAVERRDKSADGRFVYAVRSTGIYCRPSCPSRAKRRDNLRFYATAEAAEQAGFRPCLRCRPQEQSGTAIQRAIQVACESILKQQGQISLQALAQAAGYSAGHFQRLFKAQLGVSPKQYAMAARQVRFRQALSEAPSVTSAIYAAGFNTSSQAYQENLGMPPTRYRKGAQGESIHYASAQSSLGPLLVASTNQGICMLEFGSLETLLPLLIERFPKAQIAPAETELAEVLAQVIQLIDAPQANCQLPLDLRGTAFQARVWKALTSIPMGQKLSYAELAERIGQPKASRAVARACATNIIAVAVPCHRVIRGNGALAGYKWGIQRKEALLEREAHVQEQASVLPQSP